MKLVVLATLFVSGCTTNPAVMPVPSAEDRGAPAGWGAGHTWLDQHADINRSAQAGGIELVLLGDSITQAWGGAGRSVGSPAAGAREAFFEPWKVGNFGISGDRTQHVLWRIDHGNFGEIEPRAIMLLIGTNNLTAGDSPQNTAAGVTAIVERLLSLEPQAALLLLAVFPRAEAPTDPLRARVEALNRLIQPLGSRAGVRFLDLGPLFLNGDGTARHELYAADFLHLSPTGYRVWGAAVRPLLEELTGDYPKLSE